MFLNYNENFIGGLLFGRMEGRVEEWKGGSVVNLRQGYGDQGTVGRLGE